MKFKLIILISIFVFLTGCNFTINPTHGKIEIRQNNSIIENEAGIYDFGNFPVNYSSPEIEFLIENVGITKLQILGTPIIAISGDTSMFTINQNMTESSVLPGSSTVFKIKFTPLSLGVKSAIITIESSDLSKNPFTFTITGKGVTKYCWTKELNGLWGYTDVSTITDASNNIYICGSFYGTIDFGTDFNVSDIKTSKGSNDIYITKISASGAYGWTKRIGGTKYDYGNSITTDSSGNVYLTGQFIETVDFGEDFGVFDSKTSSGSNDIFITKINSNGTYGWTKRMGGSINDVGYSLTTDPSGNIFVTGIFLKTVNFGEDFGKTDNKTSTGSYNAFVTKIYADGTYAWTKRLGGSLGTHGVSVSTDSSYNIYVAGTFSGTVDFGADFHVSDFKTATNESHCFLTKINANRTYGWTKQLGGSISFSDRAINKDPSDNFYIIGNFIETVDFGKGFGVPDTKSSLGQHDVFVTKINSNGTYGWTKQMGDYSTEEGYSVTTDTSGNVYATGYYRGTVDFGKDFGLSDIKTSLGENDVFVIKINSNGTYGWTKRFGGSEDDVGHSITTNSLNNLYVAGVFRQTVNFGEDYGVSDVKTSVEGFNIFITKMYQ